MSGEATRATAKLFLSTCEIIVAGRFVRQLGEQHPRAVLVHRTVSALYSSSSDGDASVSVDVPPDTLGSLQ